MLQENNLHDNTFTYNLPGELLSFFQFTARMLCAFPIGIYMRNRIRKNKRLNYILQFKELLQVRNNIEKGSFAYDTLLFKQSPLQIFKNKSHLANLVCLAILFGDEFIDGIAVQYGKRNIQKLLSHNEIDYTLRYKNIPAGYELYYSFDICNLLPQHILESINPKYGITYKAFYGHLLFLLTEINIHLNKLGEEKAEEAAQLICKVCNRCFDTYKADITEFNEGYSLTELLRYQKTKDDDVIQVLLTLRAVLLGKKQLLFQKQFGSWSSMVRSMQLYDDMQDVASDCGFQMNVLCYFAKNYFIEEWQWLQQNKLRLQKLTGLALHSSISLYMPGSCILTHQYARNIAATRLNWVQKKIQNYLWCKNWLGYKNPLLNANGFCLSEVINKKDNSIPLKLYFIQKQAMQIDNPFITYEMKLAHIMDVALFDDELKKLFFKKLTEKEKYFLNSCYLEFPVSEKAALIKRFLPASR